MSPHDPFLVRGGRLFDGHRYLPDTAAVGVRDGRIVAMGDLDRVRDVTGAVTEVDAGGGLLSAGFVDAHCHPLTGGLDLLGCDLSAYEESDEILREVAEHVAGTQDDGWLVGGGWPVDAFGPDGPTAEQLDRVVGDRPAFLASADRHDAWVSSAALRLAGVDAETADPPDGWLVRDGRGHPTGVLRESAMELVWPLVEVTRERKRDGLLRAQDFLFSHGIVGWHDALLGGYAALHDPTRAYLDLIGEGRLHGRVRGALWWDRRRGVEQVEDLVATRDRLRSAGLDAGSVKLMVDGIAETFTASVTEPWTGLHDCPCGDSGLAFFEPDQLTEAVVALDGAGLWAHFHAIGDRAVTMALDAVEAARRAHGFTDRAHQVAHLQLVRPEDRPRFAHLGVTANLEGIWAHLQTPAVVDVWDHLDEERRGWHYPFADLVASGVAVAGGSDWPVNTPDPLAAIHVLVNRRLGADADDALVPSQALDLTTAFAAHTRGSARVNQQHTGTVQIGVPADLVLLDRDPFAGPADGIKDTRPVATWVGGVLRHEV